MFAEISKPSSRLNTRKNKVSLLVICLFLGISAYADYPLRSFYSRNLSSSIVPQPGYSNSVDDNLKQEYRRNDDILVKEYDPATDSMPNNSRAAKIFAQRNEETFKKLKHVPLCSGESCGKFADKDTLTQILDEMKYHSVVGVHRVREFDPSLKTGFCFGRAAYAHVAMAQKGIDPQNIAKVFLLGDLLYKGVNWDFHMATMARDAEHNWWVVDPLFKEVMRIEDWRLKLIDLVADKTHPLLRFYTAPAVKFHAIYGEYHFLDVYQPDFKGYFSELLNSLSANLSQNSTY